MAITSRALAFASRWFDSATVSGVFEPLIADWQRELEGSSGVARWWLLARGGSAFTVTIAVCQVTGGSAMPRATLAKGLFVALLSTVILIAIQIGLNATVIPNDFPFEMRIWIALPMILPLAIPLAMLPLMMLLRGSGQVRAGAAASIICAAALLTYLTTGWVTPQLQGDVRDALYEQMYQRDVANDRAGRITSYPATAARQARPTTAEQRATQRERWRNNPLYAEAQAERTRPRWGGATILISGLAAALGVFGCGLGALHPKGAIHATAWWALVWITLMIFDGRMFYPGSGAWQYLGRAPSWMPLAVFSVAALVTLFSLAYRRALPGRKTPRQTPSTSP